MEQRHAPWPFPFQQWVPQQTLADALKLWQRAKNNQREGANQQAALGLLQQHPELVTVVGILLDHGDPDGREFALTPRHGDAHSTKSTLDACLGVEAG